MDYKFKFGDRVRTRHESLAWSGHLATIVSPSRQYTNFEVYMICIDEGSRSRAPIFLPVSGQVEFSADYLTLLDPFQESIRTYCEKELNA